jgi:hypothetical protein
MTLGSEKLSNLGLLVHKHIFRVDVVDDRA